MNLANLKQFVLWRGEKRLVVGEEDLQTSKIAAVFKVGITLFDIINYCEVGKRRSFVSSSRSTDL